MAVGDNNDVTKPFPGICLKNTLIPLYLYSLDGKIIHIDVPVAVSIVLIDYASPIDGRRRLLSGICGDPFLGACGKIIHVDIIIAVSIVRIDYAGS